MDVIGGLNRNATRMLTGLVMGTIALYCIKASGVPLLLLVFLLVFIVSKEYVKILENKGFYPSLKVIWGAEAVIGTIAYFQRFDLASLALTLFSVIAFMWVVFKGRQPYIANVATTILGFIYCGWFPLHLIFLRDLSSVQFSDGLGFVVMLFTCILLTDIGCYYVGSNLGKHKLAPVISPNKTIEGAIGGAICAVIGALIVGYVIGLAWYLALSAGLLCTFFGQMGDLAESLIKRDAGVKDSGDMLPGHGGFLDRTDSFIFAIPVMYYFCKYFVFTNVFADFANYIKGIF